MKTETFETAEAFMLALHGGKRRQKRGRTARPDLPAAGRSAATGLTGLLVGKGSTSWSLAYVVGKGYRLYVIGQAALTTGWHVSEKAACDAAKGIS